MSQQGKIIDQAAGVETLTGNTGGAVLPDGSGNINVIGAAPYTVTGNPGLQTLTIEDDGTVATSFDTDSGSAIPSSKILNIVGGTNVSTSGSGNTVTIDSLGALIWNEITVVGPTSMTPNNGYVANNAAQVDLELPAVSAFGEVIKVLGKGAGGWIITQLAGQTIHFLSQDTTTGIGGSLASTIQYNPVTLRCITANTEWEVESSGGNLTVV